MTKVGKLVQLYFAFFKATLKGMMEYRIDFLVGVISQICRQIVEIVFLWILFQNTNDIGGWNFYQLLLLYGVTMLSVAIADFLFDAMYDIGPYYVRDGRFDIFLLRPVHPLISIMGLSRSTTTVGYFIIAIVLIIAMIIKLQIQLTFGFIISLIFFGIIGGCIIGAIITCASIFSLWTYKGNEVCWTIFRMYTFTQYPIEIYTKAIRILITCIVPFAFVAYYPTLNYLKMNMGYVAFLAPVVMIILWMITIKIWNWALNKYRSTGT